MLYTYSANVVFFCLKMSDKDGTMAERSQKVTSRLSITVVVCVVQEEKKRTSWMQHQHIGRTSEFAMIVLKSYLKREATGLPDPIKHINR